MPPSLSLSSPSLSSLFFPLSSFYITIILSLIVEYSFDIGEVKQHLIFYSVWNLKSIIYQIN